MKSSGTETVRAIGEFWILAEGQGTMPDGESVTMTFTVGYDPDRVFRSAMRNPDGTWMPFMTMHYRRVA